MSTAHCPPHRPRWNWKEFLSGNRILDPTLGVPCAHCGKPVCVAKAARCGRIRNFIMASVSVILVLQEYSKKRMEDFWIGLAVVVAFNVLFYLLYMLGVYRFAKFEIVTKKRK